MSPWRCGVNIGRCVHGGVEFIVGGVSMVLRSSSWEVCPWWCGVHLGRCVHGSVELIVEGESMAM